LAKRKQFYEEIPGDALGSQAAYMRQLVRLAETLMEFESVSDRLWEEEVYIFGVSIRFPADDRPEYLAVVRVGGVAGKQVGFHSAPTFAEVVSGVIQRLKNRTLKFKEDEYE